MHYTIRMSIKDAANSYHLRLKAAGLKLGPVLSSAKIDASTWSRWRNGSGARMDKWFSFTDAAESALAEAAARPKAGADQSGSLQQERAA